MAKLTMLLPIFGSVLLSMVFAKNAIEVLGNGGLISGDTSNPTGVASDATNAAKGGTPLSVASIGTNPNGGNTIIAIAPNSSTGGVGVVTIGDKNQPSGLHVGLLDIGPATGPTAQQASPSGPASSPINSNSPNGFSTSPNVALAMAVQGASALTEISTWGAWRQGYKTSIFPDSNLSGWVHFDIPTPAVLNGARLKLSSAYVRFWLSKSAKVTNFIVYDGSEMRFQSKGFNVTTTGSMQLLSFPMDTVANVNWGTLVQVAVTFADRSNDAVITFFSAGAEYVK